MIEYKCEICNKIFYRWSRRKPRWVVRYCSYECRNLGKTGENHHNWKGGKYKTIKGYIMARKDGKQIFEHRLIMEKYLGRNLTSKEIIHHINGIKDDNRLENLKIYHSFGRHTSENHPRRKTGEIVKCQFCDNEVYRKHYRLGKFKYCSVNCKNKAKSMTGKNSHIIEKKCIGCNTIIKRINNPKNWHRNKYCSRTCAAKNRKRSPYKHKLSR